MGNRIKEFRDRKDWTLEQLAEASGYSVTQVHRLETGARRLNQDSLTALARAFGCRPEDLISQRQIGPMRLTPVSVVGAVQAGLWRPSMEWDVGEQYQVLVAPDLAAHGAFGLEVRGPSMNLKYPDGSIVICVPLLNFWRELQNEDDVVCQRQEHDLLESTVKELRIDAERGAWLWPRSDDPEFQTPIKVPWPPQEGDLTQQEIVIRAVVVAEYKIIVKP